MSNYVASLLYKKAHCTPNKPSNDEFHFYSPSKTEASSIGNLTLSVSRRNNNLTQISPLEHKTSLFSVISSVKPTKLFQHQKDNTLPKICLTESDTKHIRSIYFKGLSKTNATSIFKQKTPHSLIKLKKSDCKIKKKTRNNNNDLFSLKTPDELFKRMTNRTYNELNRFITSSIEKSKKNVQDECNRLYTSDFKLGNRSKKTDSLRIVDHADFEYKPLKSTKDNDSWLNKRMFRFFNKHFYNTAIKQPLKLTPLQKRLEALRNTTKEEFYAKWKKLIVKAADHFKRCHLSLGDLYSGRYKMSSAFEQEFSEEFFKAIKYDDFDNVYRLIRLNKYLVHSYDHFNQTALHLTAKRNHYHQISLMVSQGADNNAQDKFGRTPLHQAAFYNSYESVLILLYEISSPFIEDKNGQTPVQLTNNRSIIHAFKRATLLHLIHSMGKRAVFEENYRRGFLWYINNEVSMSKVMPDIAKKNT